MFKRSLHKLDIYFFNITGYIPLLVAFYSPKVLFAQYSVLRLCVVYY